MKEIPTLAAEGLARVLPDRAKLAEQARPRCDGGGGGGDGGGGGSGDFVEATKSFGRTSMQYSHA